MADEKKREGRKPWTDEQKRAAAKARAERKEKAGSMKPELILQYDGVDTQTDTLVNTAISEFRAIKKRTAILSLRIYIKPDEHTAYYVINDDFEGKIAF